MNFTSDYIIANNKGYLYPEYEISIYDRCKVTRVQKWLVHSKGFVQTSNASDLLAISPLGDYS